MKKSYLVLFLCIIFVFFCLYILSLLQVFPLILALPLLFGAIIFAVSYFTNQKRFKGF
ncbi:hypothetical protein [Bacillus sp. BP-3]|uniref:hypothetical protein n=1 Tax=Bacillus sp. BP-3 TaxID=3022773 RepID=UPI00232D56B1|nr:hypothetical protein [Bacillus sp. BP-3]MDC2863918.1 hypothetical protein [Bacillus sp. BP-3]